MRHTELDKRLEDALGEGYANYWASSHALLDLGSRTVVEALAHGYTPKEVWAAVWAELELPERER